MVFGWYRNRCLVKNRYPSVADLVADVKTKICTQTIQNGITKKCSIYQKYKKNAIDINITQMMVGKQWVKR